MRPRRLHLKHARDLVLHGSGWNLTLTCGAQLERRRAADRVVEVTFKLTRPDIRCLLEAIARMHVADRERLARETARIETEKKTLGD